MENRNLRAEVLAPAGDYETFKAVINAGADAVYLGGPLYGARAYAGNLNKEELLEAIDYAHIRKRRIYLTVNTLLKNREISDGLYDYLLPLYKAGLDAVIVQDFGVMKFINDCFPAMDIHASTQMTITEPEYIDFLEKYNVTRIVPARELGLSDIKRLHEYACSTGKKRPVELECFVHGALCYAYSGQCYMSSFLGGRSGNRGRCAGTCRLEYEKNGRVYPFLSLKDLCTLKLLPDILNAGVYSLKIEGRMKSAVYAAGVTSIYRHYVDLFLEAPETYSVDEDDLNKLSLFFDRGGTTDGYYVRHNGRDMIADRRRTSKSQQERTRLETEIKSRFIDNEIKEKINIYVKLLKNNRAMLKFECGGIEASVTGDTVTEAQNRPMSRNDIEKQLTKLGATPFKAASADVDMDEGIFIPVKCLNEMRREASSKLADKLLKPFYRETPSLCGHDMICPDGEKTSYRITARVMTCEQAEAAIAENIYRLYIESELMSAEEMKKVRRQCADKGIECYFAMPRVFRRDGSGLTEEARTDKLMELSFDGVLIRNISQAVYMRKKGFSGKYMADYTVYAFNNYAVRVLYEAGFDEITFPIELNMGELRHLNIKDGELLVYGRLPLMVTAGCIDMNCDRCHKPESSFGTFKDRKNASLTYLACCRHCYNIIYNSVPLYLADKQKDISAISPRYISCSFCNESGPDTAKLIKSVREGLGMPGGEFTRGHFTKGVE